MTKNEYVSAYTMIKQVYSQKEDDSFKNILIILGIIFIIFTVVFFYGNLENYQMKSSMLVSCFICAIAAIFTYLVYSVFSGNKEEDENSKEILDFLDEYYKAGKSIDDFWEDDSLVLQKFFPKNK